MFVKCYLFIFIFIYVNRCSKCDNIGHFYHSILKDANKKSFTCLDCYYSVNEPVRSINWTKKLKKKIKLIHEIKNKKKVYGIYQGNKHKIINVDRSQQVKHVELSNIRIKNEIVKTKKQFVKFKYIDYKKGSLFNKMKHEYGIKYKVAGDKSHLCNIYLNSDKMKLHWDDVVKKYEKKVYFNKWYLSKKFDTLNERGIDYGINFIHDGLDNGFRDVAIDYIKYIEHCTKRDKGYFNHGTWNAHQYAFENYYKYYRSKNDDSESGTYKLTLFDYERTILNNVIRMGEL